MFEHNDLINNRLSALADTIRRDDLPAPRRLSALPLLRHEDLAEEVEVWEGGLGADESGPEADESEAHPSCSRCSALEHALEDLRAENEALKLQLRLQRAAGAVDAAAAAASSGSPMRAAQRRETQEVSLEAGLEEAAHPAGSKSYWRNARRRTKLASVQQRREQREANTPAKLEKAESIIERLVDEIEFITTTRAKAPAAGAEQASAEEQEDVAEKGREEDRSIIGDLKSAISDFFGGLGSTTEQHEAG